MEDQDAIDREALPDDVREAPPQALDKRRPGLRAAASHLPRLTDAALRRRGFIEASLVNDWAAVAGDEIAKVTRPDRLTFPRGERTGGTLHLVVAGAHALEMQHRAPMLVERINMVFGYGAVAKIVLRRGTLPTRPRRRPPPRVADAAARDAVADRVRSVGDDALRDALADLGHHVLATPTQPPVRGRRRPNS